jgi:hypothetical protein
VVSGELEKSLRDEVDKYVHSRLSELKDEITRLQGQVNAAFSELAERSTGETTDNMYVSAAISEHIRAAHERGIEAAAAESAQTKASSDMAILKAAVDDLDNQRTQADILNTLVNRAASFAPRVAFFVIRNEQAIGWRARGLEGTIGDDAIREFNLPLSANTLLSKVARAQATWSGAPGQNADDYQLLNRLGAEPPQRMVAIPLIVRNKPVAVLYADSAALEADALNIEALETLARVASMSVELLASKRTAPVERPTRIEQQTVPAASETQAAAPAPVGTEETAAAPEMVETVKETAAEETVATKSRAADEEKGFTLESEPQEGQEAAAQPPATASSAPDAASYQTSEAYQSYQPTTARDIASEFQPQTQASQYAAPLGSARRYGSADADFPVEVSDDEKPLHNDARRFARLLVSEIKLYNEPKVREGRSQGDIYDRLKDDIDRSREMYNKRVAPPVAQSYDYFHHELVNTLAEGDPSKLGASYPGSAR